MPAQPNTWSENQVIPSSYVKEANVPNTWLVNPQGPIDTWDDANRTWDSTYTWDGTTSQTTDAIASSWTSTEPAANNWQAESTTTSTWTEV